MGKLHNGRLLVVDDDAAILRMYERILPRYDFLVIGYAPSGSRAMNIVRDNVDRNGCLSGIDIVLSDVRMAGGDGLTFVRELRTFYEGYVMPAVVFFTAHATIDVIEFAQDIPDPGAVVLRKPEDITKLKDALCTGVQKYFNALGSKA
ncbi:MAG TPA: response regulator [Candidatus Nanoarchaeia archaeon]|nr:response regulator [Candidatus Nanoarchaeia archaeon]